MDKDVVAVVDSAHSILFDNKNMSKNELGTSKLENRCNDPSNNFYSLYLSSLFVNLTTPSAFSMQSIRADSMT